jgi:hypothetical protein
MELLMDGSKALLVMLCAIAFAACSNSIELSSKAVERQMRIDADDSEWRDNAVLVDDGRFSLGFQNDSVDLFIYIKTMDRTLERQIMMGGLTIWMDSTGGDAKYFGIRFPLGGERLQGSPGSSPDPSAREGEIERSIAAVVPECEVLGSKETDRQRVPLGRSSGIDGRMKFVEEALVYELRVGLRKGPDDAFAFGWGKDGEIGVQLETRRPERRRREFEGTPRPSPDQGRGERPPGGMRGGGRHPGNGRVEGGTVEPLDFHVIVKLAPIQATGQK